MTVDDILSGLPTGNGTEPPDLLGELRTGDWLDAQHFPPLTYHVPGVVPEGFTLLCGPPKAGKSWLVLAAALGIAHGGTVLGSLHVERRPVLYMALEDGHRRLQDRSRILLEADPIPPGLHVLTRLAAPGTVLATAEQWLDTHGAAAPLMVVDTLGRVMPPALVGESGYQRDYRVGAALKRLADDHPGAAIVVCHHTRKAAADDFVDTVSASHGLAGAADTILVLDRRRGENAGTLRITGRDITEGDYAVRQQGAAWLLDGHDLDTAAGRAAERRASEGLDERSRAIVALVGERGDGVRAAHVADALGMGEDDAGRYLRRLTESGRLVRLSRGLYGLPLPLSEASGCPERGAPPTGQPDGPDTPTPGDDQ